MEAAFLVYGVTRGGIQTAAGATEIIAAAGGTDEQVKSVSEGAEHAKTLASFSGFILLSTQEVRHHTLSEADWRHAGYLSDAETLITSRRADKAFETATETVRISRRIARAMQLGGYADKADQVKSYGKDIISGGHWAQEYLAQQELERKKKAKPPNPSGSPTPSSAGQK